MRSLLNLFFLHNVLWDAEAYVQKKIHIVLYPGTKNSALIWIFQVLKLHPSAPAPAPAPAPEQFKWTD